MWFLSEICQPTATLMGDLHEKVMTQQHLKAQNAFPMCLLQSSVECLRENLHALPPQSASGQLEALVERTEDFTDSAYTSHEQRQAILGVCQLVRQDTEQLVHAWVESVLPMFLLKSLCYNKNGNKHLIREADAC